MYELTKNGKVFTSKFVGTGPSSYEKRIYRAAVSQRLRNTALGAVYVRKLGQLSVLQLRLQEGTRKDTRRVSDSI